MVMQIHDRRDSPFLTPFVEHGSSEIAMGDIAIRKFSKDVTLKVKIKFTKEIRFRVWLATRLMNLAAFVLGCGFDIDAEEVQSCE